MAKARFAMKPLDWEDRRFKVILFGLTGFGNVALTTLCEMGCSVQCVVTRKEIGAFPHYAEESLVDLARKRSVIVLEGPNLNDWQLRTLFQSLRPDLVLASTFNRVIPKEIFSAARYAVNIHPALLPRYRGANPFTWMLARGEREAGLTAHLMAEKADAGEILFQRPVPIGVNDTNGDLRYRLAKESAAMVRDIVAMCSSEQFETQPQDESRATEFARSDSDHREFFLDLRSQSENPRKVHDLIRAHLPFPGVRLLTESGDSVGVVSSHFESGVVNIRTTEGKLILPM